MNKRLNGLAERVRSEEIKGQTRGRRKSQNRFDCDFDCSLLFFLFGLDSFSLQNNNGPSILDEWLGTG